MHYEKKYRLYTLIADKDTGEMTNVLCKDYDFRFCSERMFLHSQLDKFIDKLRAGYDNITFECQAGKKAVELKLPF